ncbi:MAG: hypothetical protein HOQ24_08540 [Mycobacteriaceae bacterium]|nr:hypothetical protein [Mycobacteriaceae bacterium]
MNDDFTARRNGASDHDVPALDIEDIVASWPIPLSAPKTEEFRLVVQQLLAMRDATAENLSNVTLGALVMLIGRLESQLFASRLQIAKLEQSLETLHSILRGL